MTGLFGQHLEFVDSIAESSLFPSGVYRKPDTLGRCQSGTQWHLDVASIVLYQSVNAIHSVVPILPELRNQKNRIPLFPQRFLATATPSTKPTGVLITVGIDLRKRERQTLRQEAVRHEDLSGNPQT
jgi:hypothetical protein